MKNWFIILFICTSGWLQAQKEVENNRAISISAGIMNFPNMGYSNYSSLYYRPIGFSVTAQVPLKKTKRGNITAYIRYGFVPHRGATDTISSIGPYDIIGGYNIITKRYDFQGSIHLVTGGLTWSWLFGAEDKLQPYVIYGGELMYKYNSERTMLQSGTSPAYPGVYIIKNVRVSIIALNTLLGFGVKHKLSEKITLFEQVDASISVADYDGNLGFPMFYGGFNTILNLQVGVAFTLD